MNILLALKKLKRWFQRHPHITSFDLTLLLRQFATLLTAGIPLIQSCIILEKSQEKATIRQLVFSIRRELLTGKNLYQCLQQHPQYFDELTCRLIHIGENTGRIDTILSAIANYQEKKLLLKKQIKQALFYPCIIVITAIIVMFSMLLFVIPRFAELFQDMHDQLPTLTVWIFLLSTTLQKFLWPILITTIVTLSLTIRNTQILQAYIVKLIQKLPPIKTCLQKITLARFTRNLALTYAAGMPITEALKLTAHACGNPAFAATLTLLCNKINAGFQLNQAMETLPDFPPLMIQMVKIGEEAGKLEEMLDKVSAFFEADIHTLTTRLQQLLEPLIMIVLGVLIGGLVIGMYLPIFQLGRTF